MQQNHIIISLKLPELLGKMKRISASGIVDERNLHAKVKRAAKPLFSQETKELRRAAFERKKIGCDRNHSLGRRKLCNNWRIKYMFSFVEEAAKFGLRT